MLGGVHGPRLRLHLAPLNPMHRALPQPDVLAELFLAKTENGTGNPDLARKRCARHGQR